MRLCPLCGAAVSRHMVDGLCLACTPREDLLLAEPEAAGQVKAQQLLSAYADSEDLGQTELGHLLGISQVQVSRILSGHRAASVAVRTRLAELVDIDSLQLGVLESRSSSLDANALVIATQAVRLALGLRNRGDPFAAREGLGPVLEQLTRAYVAGRRDPDLALVLSEARIVNSSIVGDLSSEQEATRAARSARQAYDVASLFMDDSLTHQALNALGNQLRVAGRYPEAAHHLVHAASFVKTQPTHGVATYAWMARLAAERGDKAGFRQCIDAAKRQFDAVKSQTPLINALSLGEIEVRGELDLGNITAATRLFEGLPRKVVIAAPQWLTITQITQGELQLAVGEADTALRLLFSAMNNAEHLRLPHQLQRIKRALSVVPAQQLSDSKELMDLTDQAVLSLRGH